jgi:hypothetical protein
MGHHDRLERERPAELDGTSHVVALEQRTARREERHAGTGREAGRPDRVERDHRTDIFPRLHDESDVRVPQPALAETGRVILELRDELVAEWARWIASRASTEASVPRPTLERELGLLLECMAAMIGPLRREAAPTWNHLAEHYGRVGAMRGLAAGEVVEELQALRELMIRRLAPKVWRGRPRQGLAVTLRLNRLLDRAVAIAVVGYTDMLVATLFAHNGVPAPDGGYDAVEMERQLAEFEHELALLAQRR